MRRVRRIRSLYPEAKLRIVAGQLNNGEVTLTEAVQLVGYTGSRGKRLTRQQLRNAFAAFDIPLTIHRGRPKVVVPEALVDFIIHEESTHPVGVTRMIEHVRRDEFRGLFGLPDNKAPSSAMVLHVFREYELFFYHVPPVVHPVPRCRYEAVQVNLIWHTDLHLHGGRWIIAFIDDASRRVLGAAFLPDKHACFTRGVLEQVIIRIGVAPYAVWSDNGTEFKGDFETFLARQQIRHVRTKPYNPQQNGKIERFWPTIEKWDDDGDLMVWIEGYNARPQMALPRMTQPSGVRVRMNPNDAYAAKEHWVPGTVPLWIVDGQCKTFPDGLGPAEPMEAPVTTETFSEPAAQADTTFSEGHEEEPEFEDEPEFEEEPDAEDGAENDDFWDQPIADWEVDGTQCFFGSTTPVQTAPSCCLIIDWADEQP
jgi:hypothetical protein